MKKLGLAVLLLGCLVVAGCAKKEAQTVVATINGVELSSVDYERNLERLVKAQNPQALQQPYAKDILGKRVLQDMIIKEVFLQQAKKANIAATQEEIDTVIEKVKSQFKVNKDGKELTEAEQEKAFENALKADNITKEKYLATVADDIIIEKYRRALISTNLKPVTDKETKIFFDNVSAIYNDDKKKIEEIKKINGRYEEAAVVANQLKTSLAAKVQFDLILVYADKNMSKEELAQRKQLADKIRKEIKDKSNFAEVAKKYSQQQDSKIYFSRMNMYEGMAPTELSSRALKLKVGEVSNVFEIFVSNAVPNAAQGFFIMNVVEKSAGKKFDYEPSKQELKAYINQKRVESIIAQARQTLIKEADIKVFKTFEMDKAAQQQTQQQAQQVQNPA